MKWVRERDLLIAQTMAFVQAVSGKKPAAEVRPEAKNRIDRELEAIVEKALVAAAPARNERILEFPKMSALPPSDFRQEVQSRIALFRTHQQRFHKERDEFFVATMAQLRAPKKDHTRPTT